MQDRAAGTGWQRLLQLIITAAAAAVTSSRDVGQRFVPEFTPQAVCGKPMPIIFFVVVVVVSSFFFFFFFFVPVFFFFFFFFKVKAYKQARKKKASN